MSSCKIAGFTPRIITESSRWDFIEEMVACELGVALFPESLCSHLQNRVRSVKIINPSISWKLGVIWSKNRNPSFAAKEWLRFTSQALLD